MREKFSREETFASKNHAKTRNLMSKFVLNIAVREK